MKYSTARESWPLWLMAVAWAVAWIAFSVRLDAAGDFQVFLYFFEWAAWLVSAMLARSVVSLAGISRPWLRAAWWAVGATFLLFPLGAVALASAEEVCGLYRNWTGPARVLSAQYLFREYTGLRLDQGFVDGARNVLWAAGGGLASLLFFAPILFGISLLVVPRNAPSQKESDRPT